MNENERGHKVYLKSKTDPASYLGITLKETSTVYWHNVVADPTDIPKGTTPGWYLVCVAVYDKPGQPLTYGCFPALYDPVLRALDPDKNDHWLRYSYKTGEFGPIYGSVLQWARFPADFIER